MEIEGELMKRFRLFRADKDEHPTGEVIAEYDSEIEILNRHRRQDWHYVILENQRPVTPQQLRQRIWTCEICGQKVIQRQTDRKPVLPEGYFDNCQLRDHMIEDECIAHADLAQAKRMLGL